MSGQCIVCGNAKRGKSKYFCSRVCQGEHQYLLWVDEVKSTGMMTQFKHPQKKRLRRYLKETKGPGCSICGTEKWQNKELVLVIDHIDGNAENWSTDNIRLLCPNCDSQTPTFKARNKGNGRHSRRKRYAEGKSY